MRVFVTGASGHIGSAVVPELLRAGHQVVGLARSDGSAEALAAAGAEVRRGDLDDLDGLREAAGAADGVIHLAFKHDLMAAGDRDGASAADFAATKALASSLEGTGKPLVTTSGTLMLAFAGITGRPGTEADFAASGPRVDAENFVIGLGRARRAVVRRPAAPDRAQLARSPRLRAHPDRHRPAGRRVGVRGGRGQPVAVGAHARRGAGVPAGPGGRPGRQPAARGRGRGRSLPRHRGRHRPRRRRAHGQHFRRRTRASASPSSAGSWG